MKPRRLLRFSLRTFFVVMTLFGVWLGVQVNWIRDRHALLAEGDTLREMTGNYVCGATSDTIPPAGSTVSQRLLCLFGEPSVERCFVFYVIGEKDGEVLGADGYTYVRETITFPKVHRAHGLFPEAEIVAVDINKEHFKEEPEILLKLEHLIPE